jgi:succinate-semialdehyde dehydrogenase/glutarate-semialdehyde dehydrogenase
VEANTYPKIELFIAGQWIGPDARESRPVINPATEEEIGRIPSVTVDDLAKAAITSHAAFLQWKARSPLDRSTILRRFADLLRTNEASIARAITMDMGKPVAEAVVEVRSAADHVDWHAEEGRRIYGRIIPSRSPGIEQRVLREPVGVCLAIAPWNFPISQAIRKVAGALAAGCTVILKGAGETPSGVMAIGRLLQEAGLPDGCITLVWGDSALISDTLLARPEVQKLSFTGSVPVGKHLAEICGRYMKRSTMELGGHAPVLVFDDTDPEAAAKALAGNKLRNAGQVCISPTRFYVQDKAYDRFLSAFQQSFEQMKVGNGLDEGTTIGPLCHPGRVTAMETLVADASRNGGNVVTGGKRIANKGYFYAPTIVEASDDKIALMREEPFGPVAVVARFKDIDEGLTRANSLPFGLASYVFTNSLERSERAAHELRAGMVSINHFGLALPETPFGGVMDSGYGSEGGTESFDGYLTTKFVSCRSTPVA